jgi:hypothetical protein
MQNKRAESKGQQSMRYHAVKDVNGDTTSSTCHEAVNLGFLAQAVQKPQPTVPRCDVNASKSPTKE